MAGSNATAAKAALIALIKGLPEATAEKWSVSWGFTKNPDRTWVYVGAVDWDSSDWATNRTRAEDFGIELVLNVKRRRATPEQCEREVLRLGGLIEAALKAKPNLGLAAVVTSGFAPRKVDSWPADEYCEAQLQAEVKVSARF